jgi:hypothetical protein
LELPKLYATSEQISPYFNNKGLLRELILQLNKDFRSAGIPLKLLLGKRYSFEELCHDITRAFDSLPMQTIFNLLYRVDVSEAQLKRGMPTNGVDSDLLVQLIVKRELQKVVIRKIYSSTVSNDSDTDNTTNTD